MSRNDDYITENLLDYSYHQNYYKLVCDDLSRQANTSTPQQINFTGKLEEDDGKNLLNSFRFIKRNREIKTMEHQKY